MPDSLILGLVVVFAVHLVVFARLALIRGEGYYWLVSGVFLVLTASFSLRLWAPEISWAGVPLFQLLRYFAWGLAAITLPILFMRVRARTRARRMSSPAGD